MSNSLDYHKSQLKQRAKPETSVVIRQLDTSDSFLELLLRTIANKDQNDSFEGVRYIESLLQMLNSSLKRIRADFSYLTLFLQFVRPTRSSYIRIHRSDGKVVFSVDVAITAAVLYPVGNLERTIEFTTSVGFTEKETYYVTMDPG